MNNEEKILQKLEKMDRQLDRSEALFVQIHSRLENLEQGQAAMQEDITEIKMDVAEIKEDAAITRSATNSLVEWADNVAVITQVKFPVEKSQ